MITAQHLYDRREAFAEIDSRELYDLFRFLCDGDPSPPGRKEISLDRLVAIVEAYRDLYARHRAGGGIGGGYLLDIAAFAAQFTKIDTPVRG